MLRGSLNCLFVMVFFFFYLFLVPIFCLNLLFLNYLTSGSALNIPAASLRDAADMFFAVAGRFFLLSYGIIDYFLKCANSYFLHIDRCALNNMT